MTLLRNYSRARTDTRYHNKYTTEVKKLQPCSFVVPYSFYLPIHFSGYTEPAKYLRLNRCRKLSLFWMEQVAQKLFFYVNESVE